MRTPVWCLLMASALFFLMGAASSFAQVDKPSEMVLRYTTKRPVDVNTVQPFTEDTVLSLVPGTPSAESGSLFTGPVANAATTTGTGGNIFGLNTVPTFSGAFAGANGASQGTVFPFIMMGNDPLIGVTTTIPTKVTEVSLTLKKADGTTLKTVPFTSLFDDVITDSPNFATATYDSSTIATQFADAVQRAEFFSTAKAGWHTLLGGPNIVNHVTISIPASVSVSFPDGKTETVTAYFLSTAADGSTIVALLDVLFDKLFSTQVINDINAGHFTTSALNLEIFPNTLLFSANEAKPTTIGKCCVLGFHTYFLASGVTPQPRWVTLFATYLSPGTAPPLQDVTAMSHEISEAFDDPFVNNPTPNWQFPNQPATSTVCQNNLETGDPIEVLSNPVFPMTLIEGTTSITFHPQTEALLQWFEMGATSNAISGAFSYPNKTALTKSAVPCP